MKRFLLHLRLHYQLLILPGGYLLGGLLVDQPDWQTFWLQFLNVHILLFGGATAFNSYWDKDEGPIGGLKNPPKMDRWMRDLSMIMQFGGLVWALSVGWYFTVIYALSLLLFWLYSTPVVRWKGDPLLSLVAIGISTGTNSLLLGVITAGGDWTLQVFLAAPGTALILLSLYPVSQMYQMESDQKKGDVTFAIKYGSAGVRRFFTVAFINGVVFISIALLLEFRNLALLFFAIGVIVWVVLLGWIHRLEGDVEEYGKVMNIKFIASISFTVFILLSLLLKHEVIGIDWVNSLLF